MIPSTRRVCKKRSYASISTNNGEFADGGSKSSSSSKEENIERSISSTSSCSSPLRELNIIENTLTIKAEEKCSLPFPILPERKKRKSSVLLPKSDLNCPMLEGVDPLIASRMVLTVGKPISKSSPCDTLFHVNCLSWKDNGTAFENQLVPHVFATERSALLYCCKKGYLQLKAQHPTYFNRGILEHFNRDSLDIFLEKSHEELTEYLLRIATAMRDIPSGRLFSVVKKSSGTIRTSVLLEILSR